MIVDVIRLELIDTPELARELDDEERARANRFTFERDRARFVAAHGLLRRTLARFVHREPGALRFVVGAHGKPALEGRPIEFNLSHSGDRALVAIAERPVGIDLEEQRPDVDFRRIAEQMFAPSERRRLGTTRPLAQDFYRVWTLKEALVKASGEGLVHPLDGFDVDAGVSGWTLRTIDPFGSASEPRFAAAIAAAGAVEEIRVRGLKELDGGGG